MFLLSSPLEQAGYCVTHVHAVSWHTLLNSPPPRPLPHSPDVSVQCNKHQRPKTSFRITRFFVELRKVGAAVVVLSHAFRLWGSPVRRAPPRTMHDLRPRRREPDPLGAAPPADVVLSRSRTAARTRREQERRHLGGEEKAPHGRLITHCFDPRVFNAYTYTHDCRCPRTISDNT